MAIGTAIAAISAGVAAGVSAAGSAAVAAGTAIASVSSILTVSSIAMGITSAVMTGVGAALKNEDLMFAGQIMGYVAMATGVTSMASGAFSGAASGAASGATSGAASGATSGAASGATSGAASGASQMAGALSKASSLFSGGAKVAGAVQPLAKAGVGQAVSGVANVADDAALVGTSQVANVTDDVALGASQAASGASGWGGSRPLESVQAPAPKTLQPLAAQTSVSQTPAPLSIRPPAAPTGNLNPLPGGESIVSSYTPDPNALKGLAQTGGGGGSDWLSLPDWAKSSLLMGGGQAVAGLASGYFTGAKAEQDAEIQREYLRRGAYAPLVQFQ